MPSPTTARKAEPKAATPDNTVVPGPWAALLDTVEFEEKREKVIKVEEVPPAILELVRKARDLNKRSKPIPVKSEEEFAELRVLLLSAADKLTPPASATVTRVTEGEGDAKKIVALQFSVGKRRGAKVGDNPKSDSAESAEK